MKPEITEMDLMLRKTTRNDCSLLFKWANDSEVRKNAFNPEPISWEDHVKWFMNRVDSHNTKIYILEKNSIPAGQIRFDWEQDYWKIDYSIDKEYRGLNLGSKLIQLGIKEMEGKLKAWVKKENRASCKIFENLDFIKEKTTGNIIQYCLLK